MTTKHTPGPWNISAVKMEECRFRGPYIDVQAKGMVSNVQPAIVAGRTEEETIANARLIASAPDLLEALKQAVKIMEAEKEACGIYSANMTLMVQAIAKAEGRE
jgi:hypothetical protein